MYGRVPLSFFNIAMPCVIENLPNDGGGGAMKNNNLLVGKFIILWS